MSSSQNQALVKRPVRVVAVRRGETLMDQVFQHTPIRVGRLLDNDVVLPFDFVSRYHCEIRWDGGQGQGQEQGQWVAVDLGSKNGLLLDATTRAQEVRLNDGDAFSIQEVSIKMTFDAAATLSQAGAETNFNPIREAETVIGSVDDLIQKAKEAAKAPKSESRSASRPKNESRNESSKSAPPPPPSQASARVRHDHQSHGHAQDHGHAHGPKRPLLDVDLQSLLFRPHPMVHQAREKALQMVVVWHDQVIDAKEVPVGYNIRWDFLGDSIDLGEVGPEKSQLQIPKGCRAIASGPPEKTLTIGLSDPAAFRASDALIVSFRYVPQSHELARQTEWVEQKLVDPLIMSASIHGAAAVTALFMAPKHPQTYQREEPQRFATIIVAPTPPPVVAVQPTPTPPPPPEPTPEPPPKVAEKPTPPPPKPKKIVEHKKVRKVAEKRKEEPPPKPVHKEPPPKPMVAKAEEPPIQKAHAEPPAPAPTPVFNAKSVGALKMLSALHAGPAANVANVEKIQISRSPASVDGPVMGREPTSGTGDIISKLNQSATGGGSGRGDGAVAIGGKGAGGAYQTAGLTGKAGTRKVRGTVVGGATYSELSKSEGLTREQVMKVVQKHQSAIQACYERSLMSNPDIVGRADFEWEITAKGDVTVVHVKEATIRNGESLLECVKGVFAKMKFPTAKNGESTTPTIGLPFGRL